MAAKTLWGFIQHYSQLAYEWLEGQYGTAKMGCFILSYGADQQKWIEQLDMLDSLHEWLAALLPVVKVKEPHMWGCLYQLWLQESQVNKALRALDVRFPSWPEPYEYPELPDNPADWFIL